MPDNSASGLTGYSRTFSLPKVGVQFRGDTYVMTGLDPVLLDAPSR